MKFEEELSKELEAPLSLKKEDIEKQNKQPTKDNFPQVIEFTNLIRKNYGDLVKSVLIFGSAARGEMKKGSDIDTWVILDDTATKSSEDTERIAAQIQLLGTQLKDIHIQTTNLTEFWQWIKRGSPELFNYLRAGLVIYDTGFVKPVQRMLKAGLLPPSDETIGIKIKSAEAHIKKIELTFKAMIFDLRYAATDACQAVAMYYYKETPDQKHIPPLLEKLVKEKGLEKIYIDKYKELDKMWKDVDHKIIENPDIDYLKKALVLATDIIERMKKLLPEELKEID
ncbi:MAG: nucleotidyltransferase domain-containing protein [Candidatus Aenigmarchaeota archaeon]|nr:nucleotidyltransferase domain-containing protein [Candidatus Aenigmarchaeota archaeon]